MVICMITEMFLKCKYFPFEGDFLYWGFETLDNISLKKGNKDISYAAQVTGKVKTLFYVKSHFSSVTMFRLFRITSHRHSSLRREGNVLTRVCPSIHQSVCPWGVPISHNALQHYPEFHGADTWGVPSQVQLGGVPCQVRMVGGTQIGYPPSQVRMGSTLPGGYPGREPPSRVPPRPGQGVPCRGVPR